MVGWERVGMLRRGEERAWVGCEEAVGFGEEAAMTKDVVCGMQVDEKKAAATSVYKGTTYHFCSAGCKKAFDAAPEKYAGKATS